MVLRRSHGGDGERISAAPWWREEEAVYKLMCSWALGDQCFAKFMFCPKFSNNLTLRPTNIFHKVEVHEFENNRN